MQFVDKAVSQPMMEGSTERETRSWCRDLQHAFAFRKLEKQVVSANSVGLQNHFALLAYSVQPSYFLGPCYVRELLEPWKFAVFLRTIASTGSVIAVAFHRATFHRAAFYRAAFYRALLLSHQGIKCH